MALELPQLVQRLVLDASGFKRGAAEAEASFDSTAKAAEAGGKRIAGTAADHEKAGAAAAAAAKRSQESWETAGTKMSSVGQKMSTFITLPLVGIAAASVKTAGEFEATLNTMAAVAGVPGPELKKLGELAKKMGADTVFSANEAAESMLNLAKAGVSTADIMGGGVQATLALAAAGGLDLATAATVAGNAMNTFGLEGKDAASIADALAGAANASSADVADLAMALSQGGLAANAAGLSLQETTAVLAAFADAGLRGSDAGTSLKTFLLNLVPTSGPAREAMADLGLKFTDVHGAMLPLPEIADRLQRATKDLSDEQRTSALQVAFGTDAYRAALIISKEGSAGLAEYTAATSRVGTAAEVADARMKGWAGTWEQFKGSMETAALSIGQVVIPAITPLVDKVKGLADAVSSMDADNLQSIATFGGIAAAAGPVILVAGKLAGALGSIATMFGTTALAATGWGAVAIGVAVGLALLWKNSETFRDVATKAFSVVGGYLKGVWEGQLKPLFTDFMRVLDAIKPILIGLGAIFAVSLVAPIVIGAALLKVGLEAVSLGFQVMAAVVETVGRNLSPVFGGIQKAASVLWQAMQAAWDGITGAVNAAWQSLSPVWGGIQAAWDGITGAAVALWHAVQAAWDGITGVVVAAWQVVNGVWQRMVDYLSLFLKPVFLLLQAVVTDVWEAIGHVIDFAWSGVIKPVWDAAVDMVRGVLVPVFNYLSDTAADVWGAIGSVIDFAWNDVIQPVWDAVKWAVDNVLVAGFNYLSDVVHTVWDAIGSVISTVWNAVVKPVWDAIHGFIEGPLTSVMNTFRDTASDVWDTFARVASTAWDKVKSVIGSSLRVIGGAVAGFFRVVANVADTVGLDHVAGVLRDAADSAGGWGQGMAAGGAIGSPMAVGGGFKTDGPQAVVGEGNPMYPEFVIPTDPRHRHRAMGLMMQANDAILPRHAAGTNRLGQEGGGRATGGPLDFLGNLGSSVVDAVQGAASWTLDQVRRLGRAGLEKLWPKLGVDEGSLGGIPPAGINSLRTAVLDLISSKTPPAGGAPYTGGEIGSGWRQIVGYLDSKGVGYTITSTDRPGDPGFHGQGKAVDLVGGGGSSMENIFGTLAAGGPVPGINELFYDPMGYYYDEGQRSSGAIGGHDTHVHAATFDRGGVLRPGLNLITNATGAPEHVVPGYAAGGMFSGGADPFGNPFFNPTAWLNRNVDELISGVPTPDVPTLQDLTDAPMYASPAPASGSSGVVIGPGAFAGAFAPVFHGAVSPEVVAHFNRELEEAIQAIIQFLRQGVR